MVDLTSYKAAFPEFVNIKEPIGPWSVYLWDGFMLQIVGQRKDGSIVRHQDTNEDQAAEMSPDGDDPYCEIYPSLEAMIASDKAYEEN
jgi:hypothetical protein